MQAKGRWILVSAVTVLTASACSATQSASPVQTTTPQSVSTSTATPSVSTDPFADKSLIDHVDWVSTSRGKQLQVFPTREGRIDPFPAAQMRAWNEVLADDPTAASPGMHDQFQCHWEYARIVDANKPSWNLEPWRPAVGYAATVSAQCNPGGSEE